MNENQNTEQKSMNIEWKSLSEVTKQWAVMSQFEKDLENYGGTWTSDITEKKE